jgi:hypothetical protein
MSETPAAAMRRFIETFGRKQDPFSWVYKTGVEALDDGATIIEPFLANPSRNKEHIRIILEGILMHTTLATVPTLFPFLKFADRIPIVGKALRSTRTLGFHNFFQSYARKLAAVQDDLLASLNPGELGVNILPAQAQKSEIGPANHKIVLFQVNVALWPNKEFVPQSLSVRLEAFNPDLQFSDVTPASHVENTGTFKVAVNDAGKFTYSEKDTARVGVTLGAGPAKLDSGMASERMTGQERTTGISVEESRETFTSLIIASGLGAVARWELLKGPTQPLLGGMTFAATAFVPLNMTEVTLEARVRAELERYGDYEVTTQRNLELPSVSSDQSVISIQ